MNNSGTCSSFLWNHITVWIYVLFGPLLDFFVIRAVVKHCQNTPC
jgi:hypothetical protein